VFAARSVDDDGTSEGLHLLLRVTGDGESAVEPVVLLLSAIGPGADVECGSPSSTSGANVEDGLKAGPILFMLPGVEGEACILEPLAKNLRYQTLCLQLNYGDIGQTVHYMAQSLLPVCIALPQL
jgi:hypothetical protein